METLEVVIKKVFLEIKKCKMTAKIQIFGNNLEISHPTKRKNAFQNLSHVSLLEQQYKSPKFQALLYLWVAGRLNS